MENLSAADKEKLGAVIQSIDEILCNAMPEFVPNYSVVAGDEQGFGLAPHDNETAQAIENNRAELHQLYRQVLPIVQKYHLNFMARRERGKYILRSIEILTLDGKPISKISFDDQNQDQEGPKE